MSIEALRWALEEGEARELDPPQRHILLVLGNRADEKGYLYPSISWICQRTGMARRTVQMHLKALEELGSVRRDSRPDGRGGRTSDAIWLGLKQPGLPLPDPRADFALGGAGSARGPVQDMHPPRAPRAPKKQEEKKELKTPSGQAAPTPAALCTQAYRQGIKDRYQAEYPPSAKLNGIMAAIVRELGADPALQVVRAYLASSEKWYVARRHALEFLRRDAAEIWVGLQQKAGTPGRAAEIATAYLDYPDGRPLNPLHHYPVEDPEAIARKVVRDYGKRLPGWGARNILVEIGQKRSSFSIAELTR